MKNIFLDESGYTGQNLLDLGQPVLAMASLCCEESKCADFKNRIFAEVKGAELKYSSLSKYASSRRMITQFLRELMADPGLIKVAIAHKRYALVAKMVDLILEPAMRQGGVDLYDRGGNIAFSNVLFAFIGSGAHDNLLNLFQTMMRTLDPVDLNRFVGELGKRQFDDDEADGFLDYLRVGCSLVGPAILIDPTRTLDLAFTLTFTLASLWRRDLPAGEQIRLVHDASSIMARNKAIWDAVVDINVPNQEIGYDTRTTTFPIAVTETIAEDSTNSVGVQLADVIAGATAAMGQALMKDEKSLTAYDKEIIEILNSEVFYKFSIWPSHNVTPETLGTVGPNAAPLEAFDAIVRRAEL